MAGPSEPLLHTPGDVEQPETRAKEEEDNYAHIRQTRDQLKASGEPALAHLVYAALKHASVAISHPDKTIRHGFTFAKSKSLGQWIDETKSLMWGVSAWAKRNPVKVTLMMLGLGFSAFKAKVMAQYMLDCAASYCSWSRSKGLLVRFVGFIALMSLRLPVSTLVPPTSPGFGIIIQAATPDEQKWTAMPCFLLASAVAGAWPWILDKFIELFMKEDFWFTMGAKKFADNYPLTCWTGPTMREAFHRVYENGPPVQDTSGDLRKMSSDPAVNQTNSEQLRKKQHYGKLGSSFAVIVGHVVPFMGAQTTIMQRFFLPHPLDTIVSQPFGMTEDLVSMAMAEAMSNPVLASCSLTALIAIFNLLRGIVFTGKHQGVLVPLNDKRASYFNPSTPSTASDSDGSTPSSTERSSTAETPSLKDEETPRDWVALASGVMNLLVGVAIVFIVSGSNLTMKEAFIVVAIQMVVQLLFVPMVLRCAAHLVRFDNIPQFAYEEESLKLVNKDFSKDLNHLNEKQRKELNEKHRSFADFCGPSHKLARRGALLLHAGIMFEWGWSFWQYQDISCADSSWTDWTAWAVGFLIPSILAAVEFRCLKWVIPEWQHKVHKFSIWGKEVSFWPWWIYSHAFSFAGQVTFLANAHLAGSMLACKDQTYWNSALTLSMCVALLSLVAPVVTTVNSWPTPYVFDYKTHKAKVTGGKRERQTFDFEFGRYQKDAAGNPLKDELPPVEELRFSVWAQWLRVTDWDSTHYEALTHWGRAASMQGLGPISISYAGAEMDTILEGVPHDEGAEGAECVRGAEGVQARSWNAVRYLRRSQLVARPACFTVFTQHLLAKVPQLFAQVLMVETLPGTKLLTVMPNFVLTLAVAVTCVIDVFPKYQALRTNQARLVKAIGQLPESGTGHNSGETKKEAEEVLCCAHKWFWRFFLLIFVELLCWCAASVWLVFTLRNKYGGFSTLLQEAVPS